MSLLQKTLQTIWKSKKGFTLIELMVVVAIIGILSAIAIPNFARYQSKTRQAEAKIALASVYSAEKAFYSEYTAYIGDHAAIGYTPEGFKRYYGVGWAAANTATVLGYGGSTNTTPNFNITNTPAAWTDCAPIGSLITATTGSNIQTFQSGAAGQIRQGINCDIWRIDDAKNLINTTINL